MLINHFIIASRAYSQQSPTCTRVNNLVYIFYIQPSWSISADHVCSWKRFCPCPVLYSSLCSLQNFNVTYFDITLSSHDKPHHHMMNIIYLVIEWDFRFPFMPTWRMISQKNFHIVCASGTHSVLKRISQTKILYLFILELIIYSYML